MRQRVSTAKVDETRELTVELLSVGEHRLHNAF